jgi:hypothetical protein
LVTDLVGRLRLLFSQPNPICLASKSLALTSAARDPKGAKYFSREAGARSAIGHWLRLMQTNLWLAPLNASDQSQAKLRAAAALGHTGPHTRMVIGKTRCSARINLLFSALLLVRRYGNAHVHVQIARTPEKTRIRLPPLFRLFSLVSVFKL